MTQISSAFCRYHSILFFQINAIHTKYSEYKGRKYLIKLSSFHSDQFPRCRKTAIRLARRRRISAAGTAAELQPLKSKTLMKFSFSVQGSSPSSKYIGHRSTEMGKNINENFPRRESNLTFSLILVHLQGHDRSVSVVLAVHVLLEITERTNRH